jgi:hypothetical protein
LEKSTGYEAPHYAVFSKLLILKKPRPVDINGKLENINLSYSL